MVRKQRRYQRGQAMIEYSVVMLLLLIGGVGGGLIVFLPSMMNALDVYLSGIYFMLNLAVP